MTRRKLGRRFTAEHGFTLPELLVAAVVALIVAAGGMAMVQVAVRTQPQISERAGQVQQGRAMIERVSRELRQGESVESTSASSIDLRTYVNSEACGGAAATTAILCRVTYSCTGSACSRTEHDGAGGGSTQQVVDGLLSSEVFCYAPQLAEASCPATSADDPTFVGVTLAFPADDGSEAVTLRDGVALRNHTPPPES